MKKQKQKNNQTTNTFVRKGSHLVQICIACILVTFFVIAGYGYYCVTSKTCTNFGLHKLLANQAVITFPKGKILVELVDTVESRALGLSGRTALPKDEGMLFVFDKSGKYGFWAKDMLFSLDIIWINEDGFVVDIERNVAPETYPKAYINKIDAKYVLEIDANASVDLGIFIGTKIKITGSKLTLN